MRTILWKLGVVWRIYKLRLRYHIKPASPVAIWKEWC